LEKGWWRGSFLRSWSFGSYLSYLPIQLSKRKEPNGEARARTKKHRGALKKVVVCTYDRVRKIGGEEGVGTMAELWSEMRKCGWRTFGSYFSYLPIYFIV
jgi:hypothetical protein